jgi:hypothetical protein
MQPDITPKEESWDEEPALDLFTEELDPKLNAMQAVAASASTIGSSTSFSTAGACLCSFGTIGSACTA